eukprot:14555817-Heterocapsa_arctica.AAC.1
MGTASSHELTSLPLASDARGLDAQPFPTGARRDPLRVRLRPRLSRRRVRVHRRDHGARGVASSDQAGPTLGDGPVDRQDVDENIVATEEIVTFARS